MSPEAVRRSAAPATSRARTSPLAVSTSRRATSSTWTSPEAVFTSDAAERARSPRDRPSCCGARDHCPSGQRTRTPTFGPRPSTSPDFRFRSTTISCPPPRGGHLDAGLFDHLPRDVVVAQRDQLDVDTALVAGLDADLAAVETDAHQHRAGRVEGHRAVVTAGPPAAASGAAGRRGRRPAGREAGRESNGAGEIDAAEE